MFPSKIFCLGTYKNRHNIFGKIWEVNERYQHAINIFLNPYFCSRVFPKSKGFISMFYFINLPDLVFGIWNHELKSLTIRVILQNAGEIWWLISSTPDSRDRGTGFKFFISHNDSRF